MQLWTPMGNPAIFMYYIPSVVVGGQLLVKDISPTRTARLSCCSVAIRLPFFRKRRYTGSPGQLVPAIPKKMLLT